MKRIFQLAAVLILGIAFARAEPPETLHKFKLVENSLTDTEINDRNTKTKNDVDVFYSWTSNGPERLLTINSLTLKSVIDDKEVMNDFFSRSKLAKTKSGKTYELGPDQITGPLKTVVQDSFDTPLCKLELARGGTEFTRTMLAGPGANMIVQKGIVDDALLFQPPFLANQNEWQADCEFGMQNGGVVSGKLNYKKMSSVDGKVVVTVTGTLSNDGFEDRQARLTIKHANYVFEGNQIYDLARKEWTSGDMKIEITLQLSGEGSKSSDSAKGTQSLHFEQLPD